jgi:hypothetical protein
VFDLSPTEVAKKACSSPVNLSSDPLVLSSPNGKIRHEDTDLKLIKEESKKSENNSDSFIFTDSNLQIGDLKLSEAEKSKCYNFTPNRFLIKSPSK